VKLHPGYHGEFEPETLFLGRLLTIHRYQQKKKVAKKKIPIPLPLIFSSLQGPAKDIALLDGDFTRLSVLICQDFVVIAYSKF
jgi:hypothetical protein